MEKCYQAKMTDDKNQIDKFKTAARDLECDDDEKVFKDRLRKLAKPKPKPAE